MVTIKLYSALSYVCCGKVWQCCDKFKSALPYCTVLVTVLEWDKIGEHNKKPFINFTHQLFPLRISYTYSSLTNIVPSDWFSFANV